jgi:hypothetical protein
MEGCRRQPLQPELTATAGALDLSLLDLDLEVIVRTVDRRAYIIAPIQLDASAPSIHRGACHRAQATAPSLPLCTLGRRRVGRSETLHWKLA